MLISAKDSAGLDAWRGKLGGKILMLDRTDSYKQSFKADATRYTDAQLDTMAMVVMPPRQPVDSAAQRIRREQFQRQGGTPRNLLTTLNSLALSEGAIAILSTSPRNHDGTIFVQQAGPYKVTDPANFLDIALQWEDYMTMLRLLKANMPVKLDVEVASRFFSDDTKAYNVIAEIEGTDKKLKDEVVMLGGHLDS